MRPRYRLQFPSQASHTLQQDEVKFRLIEKDLTTEMRFHDYGEIYRHPGLYEQIFYDRLKCNSPKKVGQILKQTLDACEQNITELRVLDLGAGNGMMGEVMKDYGVSRNVGVDIIGNAKDAAYRDRPDVYDEYYVVDFTDLTAEQSHAISSWGVNCLTTVAALGFGDIPASAFMQALQFVEINGWTAFNIKETFLDNSDQSGFSRLIRELIFSEYLELHHIERYRHRLSIDGAPLFYYALAARKSAEIPKDFLQTHQIDPS